MFLLWGFSMDDEEFGYIQLRKIQEAERKTSLLTKINDNFYEKGMHHVRTLQNRLEQETKTSRNMIIFDQIQGIEKILRSIYELREKKIILAAMAKARGGAPSEKHYLSAEYDFFSNLYKMMMLTRKNIFDQKEARLPSETVEENELVKKEKEPVKEEKTEEPLPSAPQKDTKNTHAIICVKEDIPTFIGTDAKQYLLHKGDILSLPNQLSNMLVSRKVAEILEISSM